MDVCKKNSKEKIQSVPKYFQKTVKKSGSISGVGLFSGQIVGITLLPAPPGTGIVFVQKGGKVYLPARFEKVQGTPRCTIIGEDSFRVQTVEHLLAVLYGMEIDNVIVEIEGEEVPILDGSGLAFVNLIKECGVLEQEEGRKYFTPRAPVYWTEGDIHLAAFPSTEYRISYTLHYPSSKTIGSQYYSIKLDTNSFCEEIASCRTFAVYEEVAPLIEQGFIKGGGLDNALILKEDQIVNPEGLRFSDEMARHKILDLIGDLSLMGVPIQAHIIAIRSGHKSNVSFAKKLFNYLKEVRA